MEDFDIVSTLRGQPSSKFRVTFDIYTPRAHFVILRRDGGGGSFMELDRPDQMDVIDLAFTTKNCLKLEQADFSVHRGSWYSAKTFHLHLCTGVEQYIDIFDEMRRQPPMVSWWNTQNRPFVESIKHNRQWQGKKLEDYAANVRNYPLKVYPERFDETHSPGMTSYNRRRLVYHSSRRRIGVVWDTRPTDQRSVLELVGFLDGLAKDVGAISKTEGCHLVVDLTGKGYPDFVTGDGAAIFGYIEVTVPVFLNSCPPAQRRQWCHNFQASPDAAKALT